MRRRVVALLAQREALLHAEAVLLIDDRQREARKANAFLDQRVRADSDLCLARGNLGLHALFLTRTQAAVQPGNTHAERR